MATAVVKQWAACQSWNPTVRYFKQRARHWNLC